MYFIPLLSVSIINLFNVELYSNMVSPRKYSCQDLDCFIKSYEDYTTLDMIPSKDAMEKRKEWQFKVIISKLKVDYPYGKFNWFVNYLTIYKLYYRSKKCCN